MLRSKWLDTGLLNTITLESTMRKNPCTIVYADHARPRVTYPHCMTIYLGRQMHDAIIGWKGWYGLVLWGNHKNTWPIFLRSRHKVSKYWTFRVIIDSWRHAYEVCITIYIWRMYKLMPHFVILFRRNKWLEEIHLPHVSIWLSRNMRRWSTNASPKL